LVILLGAPLVLLGGIGIFLGVEKGSAMVEQVEGWARELEHSADPVAMAVGAVPVISHMHVDGARIGTLESVVVLRDQPGAVDSVRLVVSLDPSVSMERYADCEFLVDPDALDGSWPLEGIKHVVHCGSDTAGFARFGTIVFAGSEAEAALYLEEDHLPCEHMSNPDAEVCDDIRFKMRRLRDEIRTEIRKEVRDGRVRITVDP
jgi:hypothetical protein